MKFKKEKKDLIDSIYLVDITMRNLLLKGGFEDNKPLLRKFHFQLRELMDTAEMITEEEK